jgi:flagellar hook-basal body complex protein FliE
MSTIAAMSLTNLSSSASSASSVASNASNLETGLSSAVASGDAGTPFSNLFSDAVGQVNALESQARSATTGLMTGAGVDVHQAMIATEKAQMGFELALSVRNKAVQAYQSVMGMQF